MMRLMSLQFFSIAKSTSSDLILQHLDSDKKKGEGGAAIENYETAFREIKEITGTSSIDEIVQDFIRGRILVLGYHLRAKRRPAPFNQYFV